MVLEIFWKWELVFLKLKADGLEYDFDFSCSPEKWYHLKRSYEGVSPCIRPRAPFLCGWGEQERAPDAKVYQGLLDAGGVGARSRSKRPAVAELYIRYVPHLDYSWGGLRGIV